MLKKHGCVGGCVFLAAAWVVGAGIARGDSVNLVANGGFDTGSFSTGNTVNWQYGGGANSQNTIVVPGSTNVAPYQAYSGGDFALLGSPSPGSLTQTLSTVAGDEYLLTFYLASDGYGSTSSFSAVVGGQTLISLPSTGDKIYATGSNSPYPYEEESADFTATRSSTPLTFDFQDSNDYLALDNVSVVQVSSPTPLPTAAAAGLMLLGVSGITRRGSRGLRL